MINLFETLLFLFCFVFSCCSCFFWICDLGPSLSCTNLFSLIHIIPSTSLNIDHKRDISKTIIFSLHRKNGSLIIHQYKLRSMTVFRMILSQGPVCRKPRQKPENYFVCTAFVSTGYIFIDFESQALKSFPFHVSHWEVEFTLTKVSIKR